MKNINNYDLNLLNVFRLMMQIRSVSKVAQKLGITQSAMSHVLNKLRAQFDDPLFHKTSHGMEPTIRAQELYETIIDPLENLTRALQITHVFDPLASHRTFVLGTSDYLEKLILPKLVRYLSNTAPNIKLKCTNYDDTKLSKELQNVDFVFGRYSNPAENLYQQTLWHDKFITLANVNHPRIRNKTISINEFINEQHILISPTGVGTSLVDKQLAKLGYKRNVMLTTHLFNTPIEIIETSDMITTMPERLAQYSSDTSKINFITPPVNLEPFEISMLWGPFKHNDPAHKWMRKTILSIAKQGQTS
ncbi:DNA-binding transcriptional regulator, LysR family [Pseudoalteromonas denitrificans DSM 6059]|uniref:DNA-binding transcriptional regulator, LysR family n=2 Tax=Pseudoalteromonas TaxID=53246 RepID=A0A1I1KBZ0_9GAMM|nr:LysR family transcriptional regulator [Pseudoalteromonas denitrificans]SFC58286.1 DNA-binding transcriptional regulator, LysR family [Pseudoalteromonas denitrificans DSM 6059]